jgi:cellulose synthase/poly-beta-1,6-N-acetylglucosamine synthase-like glycosyltransferase
MIWSFLFWFSLLAIAYSYMLYPVFLLMRAKGRKLTTPDPPAEWPDVEVIFAAYNEEKVLEDKLRSVLESDYPREKLCIRVGSDASTDTTDAILNKIASNDKRLKWERFRGRSGKSHIINTLAIKSNTKILIPTDANIIFTDKTIKSLVRWFTDEKVDIVGSTILYDAPNGKGIADQEDFYLQRENRVKEMESLLYGTAMGVEGGCYAIRRSAFHPIPQNYYMEDFFQSMQVLANGGKVLVDEEAKVYEDVSTEIREEYKRKLRISIGNFQNLKHFAFVIREQTFPLGFVFLSHKVLRWLSPFFLLTMLITAMILGFRGIGFYQTCFAIALLWIGLTIVQVKKIINVRGIFAFATHFLYMNLALFHGFIQYIKGVESNVWQPTKRKQT